MLIACGSTTATMSPAATMTNRDPIAPPTTPPRVITDEPGALPLGRPTSEPGDTGGHSGRRLAAPRKLAAGDTAIEGTLTSRSERGPAVGATVVVTSAALQGEQVVITQDDGTFRVDGVPPDDYTVTVYWNDGTYSSTVTVARGSATVVDLTLP